jgi:hypothetical protein
MWFLMFSPGNHELQDLSEQLQDLSEQLQGLIESLERLTHQKEQLESRIAVLEAQQVAAARQPRAPAPSRVSPRIPAPLPPPQPFGPPRRSQTEIGTPPAYVPQPAAAVPIRAQNLETRLGLTWVNRVAVITLLLGTAFLFKYGVDNDWFGPAVRVGLGILAAAISLGLGHRLWRKNHKVFAQGITGFGLALGYLTFWAAASPYSLIPDGAAFLLMCGITLGAVRLSLWYESQTIPILAVLGAYLTPVALSTNEDHSWILFGYVFLVNLGALALGRVRRWRVLEPLALGATALLYLSWSLGWLGEATRPVATLFALAFYAQFSVTRELAVWTAVQILAPLAMGLVREPAGLPWGLAFVAGGLAVADVRRWKIAPLWTLAGFLVPACFWLATSQGLGDPNVAAIGLSAGFVLFFLWAPFWLLVRARELRTLDLWLIVANAAAYFALAYHELNPSYHAYMGLLAVGLGLLHLLPARMLIGSGARLSLGVALAFAALAVPIQFSGLPITVGWALVAAGVAWIAARFSDRWMRLGAGVLFLLVLSRLLLIDAWVYSSPSDYRFLLNARLLTFAVSACSLWLAAEFTAPALAEAVVGAYAAGHLVLLFGLSLEIAGLVHRSVTDFNQTNVLAVAIALLMTVYAAGLVTLGLLTRTAVNRILGLGLVAFVVAKLYLMDVWQLDVVFRVAAFLALGGLLLGVSYLYSPYKRALARNHLRTIAAFAAAAVAAVALVALYLGPIRNRAMSFASASEKSVKNNSPANQPVPSDSPKYLVSQANPAPPKPGAGEPKQAPAAASVKPPATTQVLTPAPTAVLAPVKGLPAASLAAGAHSSTIRTLAPSWFWACADGKTQPGRILPGGSSLEIAFSRQAKVLVGNAAAVEIVLDGKPLGPLGPEGRARVVELTPDGFHLVSSLKSQDCENP